MKGRIVIVLLLFFSGNATSQKVKPVSPIRYEQGKLVYTPDSLGNRIPDFSYAGYKAGEEFIPMVPVRVTVPLVAGDATRQIREAIEYVASLKPDNTGFRGTVLLLPGEYRISGEIEINCSGVVLRGSGPLEGGTRLIAAGKDRRAVVRIVGKKDIKTGDSIRIENEYVPVNTQTVRLENNSGLKPGDRVVVNRPATQEWIKQLGTDHFGGGISALGWKPGEHTIWWDRTVTSVSGNEITLDAPLTVALDRKTGGGYVIPYTWPGRINRVGVENLCLISEYDTLNLKDESHAWMGITMECVEDAWIRNCTFKHFCGSAVMVLETAKRITVENCKSLQPVSEIGGQRRYTFFTSGQQCLFQRLYAEAGYHDFGLGFCASGPNAFVQCHSELPYSFSGPIDSWASGVLFDIVNVNGHALSFRNRRQEAQGAGWNAANSVFWQCSAGLIECFAPPGAQNWAFGSWAEFSGDGYWEQSNNHIHPRSLYYAQLQDRLGPESVKKADLLPWRGEASSSPSVEKAQELTREALVPPLTLNEWIDSLIKRDPFPNAPGEIVIKTSAERRLLPSIPVRVENGRLVKSGEIVTGGRHHVTWWNGTVQPAYLEKTARPHLTRFVPGRTGNGLTDDLKEVIRWMKEKNMTVLDHNYGLWYDRRRDDHERVRRITGEVWPPFYEQPFARSGRGIAYDGLSKYDLTKYNDWYWSRLRRFVEWGEREGRILFHQHYFQHNIIEAGAHWTDSPWRPANNVNDTGFPEPAPYAGDKRIFLAEQFYDTEHPVRNELHRAYIRKCLDNFRGLTGVVHLISEEYTGPLHFVEFWLDVIAEWKSETGEEPLIALSVTKDVQDRILSDPIRSKMIDVIDIRYWFYREDGTTYAPGGGLNLAPRQHARLTKPGKVSFESVYRAVKEYRTDFPEKAVTYFSAMYPQYAWAVFMAGGSLAGIPEMKDSRFLKAAASMQVQPELSTEKQYVLGDPERGYIIYSENKEIDLSLFPGKYEAYRINSQTGEIMKVKMKLRDKITVPDSTNPIILWLLKK